jgi:predicted amidohydrolase
VSYRGQAAERRATRSFLPFRSACQSAIRPQRDCEDESRCHRSILCCPEAILGGLADYAPRPAEIAIDVEGGQLAALLTPLVSDTVTTILGFTETARTGHLYNSAAVFHRRMVTGIYRRLHPAMRQSIYSAGDQIPVFRVAGLTFGIVICNDSNYPEPARIMASQGASVWRLTEPAGPSLLDKRAPARNRTTIAVGLATG